MVALRLVRFPRTENNPRDVWGYVSIGRTRTVDAHACRLRRKLSESSGRPWIVNVRGVGYRLTEGTT